MTLSGSGLAELGGLVVRDAHAVVAGSGRIDVTATSTLRASVPGTGAIFYGGNPKRVFTTSVTGKGAITPGAGQPWARAVGDGALAGPASPTRSSRA